ncbi:MAG: DUF4105 domain-containing protein [Nevskiales bacterium]
MKPILDGLLVSILLLVSGSVAAADTGYLQELQGRARELRLAEARGWRVLLHYENGWLGSGPVSTAVTSWFFNAPDGDTDPQAELDATLAAFFQSENLKPRDEPPQCVFSARYQWLKSRLEFDPARLPEQDCPRFQVWLEALNTNAITMVFPAAYLNSPASMFGHTLLRLDAREQTQQTELLAYAVNFAAETVEDNGLIFAVRGLTGGYAGSFGIYPYYEKVKEYARIENRDLWEYQLRLSPAEIERMLRHLWELRGVTFDYYFLKYNCSYQLLALLESARPELDLVDRFRGWAVPTDTLRALRETPTLVGHVDYRPALSTVLASEAGSLSTAQTGQALRLARAGIEPSDAGLQALPPREQARTLQVAHDYLYYQYLGRRMPRETALPRAREILLARSQVKGGADFPSVPRPDTVPDDGHETRRVSVGVTGEDGRTALSIRLRPAYHDLLDPPGGYGTGAQIKFLDVGLSLDTDTGDARLEDLRAIDIVSIAPRDALFKPVSWRFSTGLRRPFAPQFDPDAPDLGLYFEGGPGLAWGTEQRLGYVYALGSLDLNRDLERDHSAGLGAAAGLLLYPRREWGLLLELGTIERLWGDRNRERWASLGQQWQLSPQFGLRLELKRRDTEQQDWGHVGLSSQWYF